jgi:glycosyltransferase involved in cell wall biosynthesis
LIVSYYFPPAGGGGVQRWTKLIKYLSRMDWRFTVISARTDSMLPEDNSLLADIPETTKNIRISNAEPAGRILKQKKETPYWKRWLSAFYHITDSRAKWNLFVLPAILKELDQNHYDAVIITIPPYSLAELAAYLTAHRREPVILDMRDPWSINPYKIYPTPMHRLIDQGRETRAIDKIKYLISAYHSIIDHYSYKIPGFEQKRSVVVTNGYDKNDLPTSFTKIKQGMSVFKIAFSGTFYSHLNHPGNLFKAMQILNREGKNIHFYHIGKSAYDLLPVARKYGQYDFFHSLGYLSHVECLNQLQKMDAFVLILDDRVTHADKTIGGKIYEYLALQKPIAALVPEKGEAAALIRSTDSGIICPYSDVQGIVATLRELAAGKRTFQFSSIDNYSREHQALQLNQFLERILSY